MGKRVDDPPEPGRLFAYHYAEEGEMKVVPVRLIELDVEVDPDWEDEDVQRNRELQQPTQHWWAEDLTTGERIVVCHWDLSVEALNELEAIAWAAL